MFTAFSPTRVTLFSGGLVICLAASACQPQDTPESDMAADTAASMEAQAPTLTDAQIAHVAVTANAIDSAMGQLASTIAADTAVQAFAQTMITDHGAVNVQAVQLAEQLGVVPEANDVSSQLQQAADAARAQLETLTGAEFDQAYMDREVEYHQAVLDALDQTLIPGAQNAELRALLESVRPAIAAHLERATEIQGRLGSP